MDVLFWIDLFQRGSKFFIDAYGKVFKDVLTRSLKEFSAVSPEYEPLGNCLLEIIEAGSIEVQWLPDKGGDHLRVLSRAIGQSEFFRRYCDPADYPDAELKRALVKFFEIFENCLTQNQELFNRLQLEYSRKLCQYAGKATKDREEMKSRISVLERKLDKVISFVTSEQDIQAAAPLDPAGAKSKHLDTLFGLALELAKSGRFRQALRKYREFLNTKSSGSHRKHITVLNNMAAAYLEIGSYRNAAKHARLAHEKAPRRSLPLLNLGIAHFFLGKLDDALAYVQKAARRRAKDPNVYNTLSIIYAEKHQPDKAFELVNEALRKDDRFAPAYVNRAILLAQRQEFDRALSDVSKAIELESEKGDFYVNLAMIYENKLFDIMKFEVLQLDPRRSIHTIDSERLQNLSEDEDSLLERAIESYEKALELGVKIPQSLPLAINLADCYRMKERYQDAERIYKQIRVKHEKDYPYYGLAGLYFATGRFKEALTNYHKMMSLHGESSHLYNCIARTYAELKDFDNTIENLQKAIELDPQNSRYRFNLGLAYFMSNRLAEAQRTFEELKNSGFDPGSVAFHLGRIFYQQRMWGSAAQEFLLAKEAGVPRHYFSEFLAVSAYEAGRKEIAREELEYLLSQDPDNTAHNFNYAEVLFSEGDGREAKKHYIKALKSKDLKKYPKLPLLIPKRLYDIDRAHSRIIIP